MKRSRVETTFSKKQMKSWMAQYGLFNDPKKPNRDKVDTFSASLVSTKKIQELTLEMMDEIYSIFLETYDS